MQDTKRYIIKLNKVEELKAGRSLNYIAGLTDFSRQYLSEVFLRKRVISSKNARRIAKSLCEDVVYLYNFLNKEGIDTVIDYFFEKV